MAQRLLAGASTATAVFVWILLAGLATAQEPVQETIPDVSAKSTPAAHSAAGQISAKVPADKGATKRATQTAASASVAEAVYQKKFSEWKKLIKHLRQIRTDYHGATPSERAVMGKDWEITLAQGEALLPELIDSVLAAYTAAPNADRVKTTFLAKVVIDYAARDLCEEVLRIGGVLVDNDCDLPQQELELVYRETGMAAFALNQYERASAILGKAQQIHALSGNVDMLRAGIGDYGVLWDKEVALRAKEAEADDLPRVKLVTTKGDIIVELFENEAPDTVGNFISLVKKKFYDDLAFHRVVSGFMAQTGCPRGDGTGDPGYRIYDECNKPDARRHFRGSLSMAKTNAPNSGGSQFFITFRPTGQLDGQHTVFGRVIEGMDVVCQLQRRKPDDPDAAEPDRIIKAQVLRDRGHEYVPKKVE